MRTTRVPSPSQPRRRASSAAITAALVAALTAPALAATASPSGGGAARSQAVDATHPAGYPGAMSHFGLARKDCLGTSRTTASRVWFTVANGVLSDVSYPTIDTTNVETLQLVVTDGRTFTDLPTRDATYEVQALDAGGMACRVVTTPKRGTYRVVTDYVTDPARSSVVVRTSLQPVGSGSVEGFKVYARFDPTINGNGGGGDPDRQNAGADDATVDTSTGAPVPVSSDEETATIAANRDYAEPVHAALRADRAFKAVTSGYAGSDSDGLTALDADHALPPQAPTTAEDGNVVQVAQLDLGGKDGAAPAKGPAKATLVLGFGKTQADAVATAGATLQRAPQAIIDQYVRQWDAYAARLTPPPPGLTAQQLATYRLSANVLKASEDKTFPGAVVASLASPWGQAVAAGDPALTYWGSYREVFARDLYESVSGLLASGDEQTATAAVRWLFDRQQQADGSFPRNSLVNGKTAPDSFGVQLDEVAYPLLLARTVDLIKDDDAGRQYYRDHLAPAAQYLIAHGPAFGSERWEEQSGYSPSTIAAQIAGLLAAAELADVVHDSTGALLYRATADSYERQVKGWTVTTTGPLSDKPYFIRLSKNGDPDEAVTYNLGNGGPDADQRAVVDAGFLELVRLGILRARDADVSRSLAVVDRVIKRDLPGGDAWYRYGTASEGTEDGYGDCFEADPTDCGVQGKPWAAECTVDGATQPQNKGSGHVWPVLAGERGEYSVIAGNPGRARQLLASMAATGSGLGLIPEQAWENPDLPASPYGTPPECASIGFERGKAAGSAAPLTWAAAQYVRLSSSIAAGRVLETPQATTTRYLTDPKPKPLRVTITAPADAAQVGSSVTVTGRTEPGAAVAIVATNTDIDGASRTASAVAGADGRFAQAVTVPSGTVKLTVAASLTTNGRPATGTAALTVAQESVPGTRLFAVTDPDGDDVGPGTYAYPSASDFKAGAYDLQAFEVYDSGPDTVTMRVRTRDLSPTFGSPLGAQLLDVYVGPTSDVHGIRSTEASFPQRNYRIADDAAWTKLIEVQGFGQRLVAANGVTVGSVAIRASAFTRWITFTVTKAALGGTPGPGWTFAVVLTGQDGFSPDQARGFTPLAEPYQFGRCTEAAQSANDPVCAVDVAKLPKAVDILTPPGVDQSDVLDPTRDGGAVIPGVVVP
ncbi:MAG: glucodextranase DOMON-like domain-containing protein [Kineosporiaceae bacterium]